MTGSWIQTGLPANSSSDTQRLNNQLRQFINALTLAAELGPIITNTMAQMVSGTDYTTIESAFGLQAGTGQSVHDIVGTANTDLQGSNIQGLIQRLQ